MYYIEEKLTEVFAASIHSELTIRGRKIKRDIKINSFPKVTLLQVLTVLMFLPSTNILYLLLHFILWIFFSMLSSNRINRSLSYGM